MKHTITHYSDIDFTVHGLRITHWAVCVQITVDFIIFFFPFPTSLDWFGPQGIRENV